MRRRRRNGDFELQVSPLYFQFVSFRIIFVDVLDIDAYIVLHSVDFVV